MFYFLCHRIKFGTLNFFEFAETRQFLPLKPWNHMHMQVENVLSCGFAVLLDDADAVGVGGFFDCRGNLFGNYVNLLSRLSGMSKMST